MSNWEGEYRYLVAALDKVATDHPQVRVLRHLAHIGQETILRLEPSKPAPSALVVQCALLRDGNLVSLDAHRRGKRMAITSNTDGAA